MQPSSPVVAAPFGVVLLFLAAVWPLCGAVTLHQTSDFQDGSRDGWAHGDPSPIPPEVFFDVGPTGAGDHSLYVTSFGGFGPGGRWITFNRESHWLGDYIAAGFETLQLDVFNFTGNEITLRVGVIGLGGSFVTEAVHVDDTNSWESITFSLAAGDLLNAGGSSAEFTLMTVREIRIFENAEVSILGDTVFADVYLDNITALPGIPEPSRMVLVALGLAAVIASRRRRRSV